MKLASPRAAGLALLLAATAATASFAQPAPPAAAAPQAGRGHDPAQREARMAERRQHMTQRLRDVLQLTPAQEPALQQFLASTKPPAGAREDRRERREDRRGATTPERLDQRRQAMAERQAAFDRMATATRAFYAQLTPAQQKAFDAMPKPGHRFGRHGGRGDHGGWRRGGPEGPGMRG